MPPRLTQAVLLTTALLPGTAFAADMTLNPKDEAAMARILEEYHRSYRDSRKEQAIANGITVIDRGSLAVDRGPKGGLLDDDGKPRKADRIDLSIPGKDRTGALIELETVEPDDLRSLIIIE